MNSRSWEELEALAESHFPSFNHIHCSALVCRLPKLVTPSQLPPAAKARFARFLGRVSDLVSLRLPTFDPRAVANVLWGVSKLGYSPAPTLLNKFLFEAYVHMDKFNAQELANLSWALATLAAMGNRPVPAWLAKFTAAAVRRVAFLKPQELAHMTWALSRLCPRPSSHKHAQPQPSPSGPASAPAGAPASPSPARAEGPGPLPELVTALAASAASRVEHFSCGELVMTLDALHRLDPAAAVRLLRPALPHLLRVHAAAMSPQDLALLWVLLGKCAIVPALRLGKELDLDQVLSQTQPTTSAPSSAGSAPEASDREGPHEPLASADGRSSGGRRVGRGAVDPARLGRQHLYALLDVTERSLHGFSPQGLCLALVAWARLHMQPSPAVAAAVCARFQRVLPAAASFQAVSVSLWAMAQLRFRPEPQAVQLLVSCAALQAPMAKPHELLVLLWALQKLRWQPPPAIAQRLGARLGEVAGELRPQGLQLAVSAFTLFGEPIPAAVAEGAVAAAKASMVSAQLLAEGTAKAKGRGRGKGRGKADASAVKAAPTALPPLSALTPRSVVRFFSTLAGVAVPRPATAEARAASLQSLRRMRWRLLGHGECPSRRRGVCATLEAAVSGHLHTLSLDAMIAMLGSMARMRLSPSHAFMSQVFSRLDDSIKELPAWHAGRLLSALGRLGVRPPASWLTQLLDLIEPQYDSLSHRQLLGVLRGLVQLRYRPTAEWMQSYFDECLRRLDEWPASNVDIFLTSLHGLGMRLRGAPCQQLQLVVYRKRRELQDEATPEDRADVEEVHEAERAQQAKWRRARWTQPRGAAATGPSLGAAKPGAVRGLALGGRDRAWGSKTGAAGKAGLLLPRGRGVRGASKWSSARDEVRRILRSQEHLRQSLCKVCEDLSACRVTWR
ncbi:hypothetical protein HYH03_002140 [Edaphochlamys debaryana]|uniref:Uncharacterized protein n=1 Tax=Edaphochlamys debaryana TaxID=47281 RepID=A0A835YLG2_9CHLO|nr:hypothetical protein HYH03_002140 [Edaphochlamys debaryana]|eukprot:KAG2499849.1 hypothetical protein HYH03_002140 [Edaphochlamys debaryana]